MHQLSPVALALVGDALGDDAFHGEAPRVGITAGREGFVLVAEEAGFGKAVFVIRRDFETAFKTCDALLAPVSPTPAYRIGEKSDDPLQMYLGDIFTVTANLAGICGLSVPCGETQAGLPIGLQILGPAFGEEKILQVGQACEQAGN